MINFIYRLFTIYFSPRVFDLILSFSLFRPLLQRTCKFIFLYNHTDELITDFVRLIDVEQMINCSLNVFHRPDLEWFFIAILPRTRLNNKKSKSGNQNDQFNQIPNANHVLNMNLKISRLACKSFRYLSKLLFRR